MRAIADPVQATPREALAVRWLKSWWPLVVLAALVAFGAGLAVHYGLASHYFQPDEFETVDLGRRFNYKFFGTLFEISPWGRGPERLLGLVFALPDAIFTNTATVFEAAHVLFGLIYVSAFLPVYLLARGAGLQRWQAVFPAAAAILTPWLLFGGSMLNITLAYPAAMALAWATWKAAVRPGLLSDVLVLLFGLLGAMAREGNTVFLVAVALVLPVAVWRAQDPAQSLGSRLRAYPRDLARAHPLLLVAAGAAAVLVAVHGLHSLVGSAYQPPASGPSATFSSTMSALGTVLAELTMGTGYLPMIIGLPWMLRELMRPRTRETGSLALVAGAFFLMFVATVVATTVYDHGVIFTTEGADERYVAVLAGLPPLLAALALFRREASPWAVAITGILLSRVIVTDGLHPSAGSYDYFIAPARLFFTGVMQGQVSTRLPFNDTHVATTLMVLIVTSAVVLALLSRRRWANGGVATAAATLALGAPIALGAVAGIHNGDRFETLATYPTVSFHQLSLVDQADHHQAIAFWDYAPGGDPRLAYDAQQASFFNGSLVTTLQLAHTPRAVSLGPRIVAFTNPRTGELRTKSPLTSYVLAPVRFTRVGLDATVVAGPITVLGLVPLDVERVRSASRLAYAVTGTEEEGWIVPPSHSATIRLFASSHPECWRVELFAPAHLARPIRYIITGSSMHLTGALAATAGTPLFLRSPAAGVATVNVRIRGGGTLYTGAPVAAGFSEFTSQPCPR